MTMTVDSGASKWQTILCVAFPCSHQAMVVLNSHEWTTTVAWLSMTNCYCWWGETRAVMELSMVWIWS